MKKHDDTELIELFRDFETIITDDKAEINWFITSDFKVYSEYLIRDIKEIQVNLKKADDEYLFYVCEHIFNILDWITLFVLDAGLLTFNAFLEIVFEEHFGNRYVLSDIYEDCFKKWLIGKSGQYQVGANIYSVLEGKLYYRNRFGGWFVVSNTTAFDLKPDLKPMNNQDIIKNLNVSYKETWYDEIIKDWDKKSYTGKLSVNFMEYENDITDPDSYLDFSLIKIKELLKTPISISELERWSGGEIVDLEHIVKMAFYVLDLTKKRREDNSHTLYLLRDCLTFQEMHKTLDILSMNTTSSDQILVGRKLLSHKTDNWGYYSVVLEALFSAHLRYPENFEDFYNEFARLMDLFVSENPRFAALIDELSDYIKPHIQTDKVKIEIFDTGFQGSINLLTKYIINKHIKPVGSKGDIEVDIKIGVGAQWSKDLFGDRYYSDYFPLLNHIQLLKRSNELYHYKYGSLQTGNVQVVMGNKDAQHKAAIEMVVMIMVVLIAETKK